MIDKKLTDKIYNLGKISLSIAKQAHIKCAKITISYSYILHIQKSHAKELEALNMNAYDYVKMIIDNFDQIRQRKNDAIILVKTNTIPPHDTCIVELTYNQKKSEWQVKTAQPRRKIETDKLLWDKKR